MFLRNVDIGCAPHASSNRLRVARWALLFSSCFPSAVALADDSAADMAAARDLGKEGIRLADAGDCVTAIDKLQRAEALHHAPTILGRLGECQVMVGKIVAGTETLQKVVREDLLKKEPAFVAAQERAHKVLDGALPKIGRLKIRLVGPRPGEASVTVDGETVSGAMIGENRPTDPGLRTLEAHATGYRAVRTAVEVREGGTAEVTLTLEPEAPGVAAQPAAVVPAAPPAPPGSAPAQSPPTPTPSSAPMAATEVPPTRADTGGSGGGGRTAGWVVLGVVGGGGLIVGSAFGLVAMGKKSTLDTTCQAKVCPSSENLDSAKSAATVSNIGFGIGLVGVAVGVVLIAVGGSSKASLDVDATSVVARRRPPVSVSPWIGLGGVGLNGSFQ